MAHTQQVKVKVTGFRWFKEILVRARDLVEALEDEPNLSESARRHLRSFRHVLFQRDAENDDESDLFPP